MSGALLKRALRHLVASIGILLTMVPNRVALDDQSNHQYNTMISSIQHYILSSIKFGSHFSNRWDTAISFRHHYLELNQLQTNARFHGIQSAYSNHTFAPSSETSSPSDSEPAISVTASVVTALLGSFILLGLCAIAFYCHCLNPNSKFYISRKTVDKLVPNFIQIAHRSKRLSGLSEVEAYWRGQNNATSLTLEDGRNTLGFGINGESEISLRNSNGRPLSSGTNGTGISPQFGRGKVITAPNRKSLSGHSESTVGQIQVQPTARDSLHSQQSLASARQDAGTISVTLSSSGDRHTEILSDSRSPLAPFGSRFRSTPAVAIKGHLVRLLPSLDSPKVDILSPQSVPLVCALRREGDIVWAQISKDSLNRAMHHDAYDEETNGWMLVRTPDITFWEPIDDTDSLALQFKSL